MRRAIFAFLALILVLPVVFLSVGEAQVVTSMTTTLTPNPVYDGEQVRAAVSILPLGHVYPIRCVVTKPDGTSWSLGLQNASDVDGKVSFDYTPELVGTYQFHFYYYGETGYPPCEATSVLTVQQSPLTPIVLVEPASISVAVGQSVTFTASASGGTPPYSYQWFEWSEPMSGQTSSTLTISKTSEGAFNYYCRVNDSAPRTTYSDYVQLTVTAAPANVGPVASFVCSPSPQEANKVVSFDASASSDSDGSISDYSWSFGDGSSGSGKTTTHIYTSSGTFTVSLTTTDNGGLTASKSLSITVTPAAGVAGLSLEFVAVGVVVAAVVVVAVLLFLKWRKRRPKKLPTPAPTQLRITAEPSNIVADGTTKSVITLQLLDKDGKPISAIADTQVKISASNGKLENPTITVPKGKAAEQTVIVSSREPGQVPVSAEADGLKGVTITLNFLERKRYCLHCGALMPSRARACENCGKAPPAGVDTKVCHNCGYVIPNVAKFCSECGSGQKE